MRSVGSSHDYKCLDFRNKSPLRFRLNYRRKKALHAEEKYQGLALELCC
jgi:hypothetical protein